jgi:hypothetical protein
MQSGLPKSYAYFQGFKPKDEPVWKASGTIFDHGQQGLFPLCWTGGQGTDPNEQNTQQSPANGLSFCPQPLQT